jgi:hypothetical protein
MLQFLNGVNTPQYLKKSTYSKVKKIGVDAENFSLHSFLACRITEHKKVSRIKIFLKYKFEMFLKSAG